MMMINKYIACTALAAFAVCKTVLAEDEYLHQSASDWDMRIADVKLLSKDIAVGQYATFGSFEQDSLGDDGKEPIVWLVADKKDSKALLVSRYSLDILPFNEKFAVADWEHSTARAWLAHYFLINAFSQKERAKIVLTDVSNQGDETNGIPNQPSTKDFVFLLSAEEAKVYLKDGGFMKAAPTPMQHLTAASSVLSAAPNATRRKTSRRFHGGPEPRAHGCEAAWSSRRTDR